VNAGIFLGSLVVSRLLIHYVFWWFRRRGRVGVNYRDDTIPLGYGIIIPFVILSGTILCATPLLFVQFDSGLLVMAMLCLLVALAGWLDDHYATKTVKGLTGHWLALINERKITTGAVKALTGLFSAVISSFLIGGSVWNCALNALLIALSINLINLLDLRPGRALKGFWLLLAISYFIGEVQPIYQPLLILTLAATLAGASADFSGRAMMGDTGSNSLGYAAGVLLASSLPLSVRLLLVVSLLTLHVYAESGSLTHVIHKNKWLRTLDEWGRQPE
jgi:UDP-GlcNAc:undecaprenyl-phosphate/decaprenyl-phosphate GlcNAc-1-phosphate transferase